MDEFSVPQNKFVEKSSNDKHGGGVGMYVNQLNLTSSQKEQICLGIWIV